MEHPEDPRAPQNVPVGQPRLSDDRRFFWDGTRWVPMPADSSAGPHGQLNVDPRGIALTAGGLIAAAGVALPWVTSTTLGHIAGTDVGDRGSIVIVLGVVAAFFGVLATLTPTGRIRGLLYLALPAGILAECIITLGDLQAVSTPRLGDVTPGYGLILSMFGAVIVVAACAVFLIEGRARPA